jgi:hypothetical protein
MNALDLSYTDLKTKVDAGEQLHVGICDISIYLEFDDYCEPAEYIVTESYPSHVEKFKFSDFRLALDKLQELHKELLESIKFIKLS